jgi:hypothetical protein
VTIAEGACELRDRPEHRGWGRVWTPIDFSEHSADYAKDPRWPTVCACGYVFTERAERQISWDPLYVGSPDGVARRMRDLLVGAVYRAEWYEHGAAPYVGADPAKALFRLGPDGICLEVMTPRAADGSGTMTWCVDQRSANGGFWTRNAIPTDLLPGAPVPLHCEPSIFQFAPTGFHGWLHNGAISSV